MDNVKRSLSNRVHIFETLFDAMHNVQASSWQIEVIEGFKRDFPDLIDDLEFCLEVLAGKHKIGFSLFETLSSDDYVFQSQTIRDLVLEIKAFTLEDKSELTILKCCARIPKSVQSFMVKLVNREYRLGYSGKADMVTDKHCMLAKTYPQYVSEKYYYIQEKLNGNRCIAYYKDGQWKFISRSQKPLNVNFDMIGFDTDRIYDGEIMTRGKMGNRDFTTTTGVINSKYGDKSQLIYIVYDILDSKMPYKDRLKEMDLLRVSRANIAKDSNTTILPVLDYLWVNLNPQYNCRLDEWLDKITSKGGEGIMLRDPDAPYYHSKNSGDRKPCLLKYKKTKTCDLRIVGWNEGKGKYTGMIGSFICETDDHTVRVSVAGISDDIRMSNPNNWIGKIIEVAYFDSSQAKNKTVGSLQFPRMKCVRDDKTETSMF